MPKISFFYGHFDMERDPDPFLINFNYFVSVFLSGNFGHVGNVYYSGRLKAPRGDPSHERRVGVKTVRGKYDKTQFVKVAY